MSRFSLGKLFLLLSFGLVLSHAQVFLPTGAHVDLYFSHLADGGDNSQRWQTSFGLVNPTPLQVTGTVSFFGQDGNPLSLQVGNVSSPTFSMTIRPSGSLNFLTTGTGSLKLGWAFASFDGPVQGTLAYRVSVNESPRQEVTVNAVLPTPATWNFATAFSGIAIANPWTNGSAVATVTLQDSNGVPIGSRQLILGPLQQTARVLGAWFNLPATFNGTVSVSTDPAQSRFFPIVLVINADQQGVISSSPNGSAAGYVADINSIRLAFRHLVRVVNAIPGMAVGNPNLVIDFNRTVNARASADGTVRIESAVAQLLGSLDEIVSIVAHELGHIYQFRTGTGFCRSDNLELDADCFGLFASLFAGYDPYATGGAMGKVMMATGTSSLLVQVWEDLNRDDAHKSFSTRITNLWATMAAVCSDPRVATFCQQYNRTFHPNVPGPLLREMPTVPAVVRLQQ